MNECIREGGKRERKEDLMKIMDGREERMKERWREGEKGKEKGEKKEA